MYHIYVYLSMLENFWARRATPRCVNRYIHIYIYEMHMFMYAYVYIYWIYQV